MIRTTLCILLSLALGVAAAGQRPSLELTLLATTDLHCRLMPDSLRGGGIARVAGLVAQQRALGSETVLLDIGDTFEGSPVADYYATADTMRPHPLAAVMNHMGYAAMALGNHEFTYGSEFIARIASQLDFPLLAANVKAPMPAWTSHVLLHTGGARVLVIGLTTPWAGEVEGPWLGSETSFRAPAEELLRLLPSLRAQVKPDVVCVLAHAGLGKEDAGRDAENHGLALARTVPGIDVLFLGHSHMTADTTVGRCLVLQAGSRGSHLAVARLTLAPKGKGWVVASREGELLSTAQTTPDSEVVTLCTAAEQPVVRWLDETVGSLGHGLTSRGGVCRLDDLSRLITDIMVTAGDGDVALVSPQPDGATITAGSVHRRDLYRLEPYLNRLITVRMSPASLVETLEHAASTWAPYAFDGQPLPTPAAGVTPGSFLVAGGLSYVLDYTAPPGQRLAWVRYGGRPLGDSLDVVMTNYHRSGPAGYRWLRSGRVLARRDEYLRDLLADRLRAGVAESPPILPQWWSLPTYRGHWAQPALDMLLSRAGPWGLAGLDWAGRPSPALARDLCEVIMGTPGAMRLTSAFEDPAKLTRGELLVTLLRTMDDAVCTRGAAAQRFDDCAVTPAPSMWDSVVSSGLVAFLPGDSLGADEPLTTADVAGFLLNGRYRALTVASSNDFHGHLERTPRRGYAGIEAMACWVAEARKANPEGVILLDAGDAMQGTPISNLFQGSSTIALYRRLGYDALAVGNHDFDWGQDVLKARILEAGFPFLGANVLAAGTDSTPEWLRGFTMVERGGARVAVMGFGTPETPWVTLADNVAGLEFEDPSLVFDRLLPTVQARRPDLIVVLGHLGLEDIDGEMVGGAAVLTDAAAHRAHVFFNGHTHQFYATRLDGLPHLQGGSYGRAYSVARAWVDRRGVDEPWVLASHARLSPSMRDPATAQIVEGYRVELAPKTEVVITELAAPVPRITNEAGESLMGRLIAESQRWMTGDQIGIMNTGGVRSDLDAGPVTWQELFTVQPFGNTLVRVTLTGKDLLMTLEQGIHPGGASLQLAGIDVWMDTSRGFGQRVVRAQLEDGGALDPGAEYHLVVNNFMAGGGDGFTILRDAPTAYDTGIVDLDAMIAYLKSMPQPITVELPWRLHLSP